jgi:hypothetical protein
LIKAIKPSPNSHVTSRHFAAGPPLLTFRRLDEPARATENPRLTSVDPATRDTMRLLLKVALA